MEENSISIAQDNKITLSRHDFTPIEKRCLYHVIKEVRRVYVAKELKKQEAAYKNIFEDMYLQMQPDDLRKLGDETKDVYNALRKLRQREIEILTDDEWICTSWILQAKHNRKADTYEVQVSKDILPYLVELASKFTEYSLTVAITLKSTYSQRFYEICNMYRNKGKFFLDVEKLRYMLKIEEKKTYRNVGAIKQRIIEVAQKELEQAFNDGQSDIYFTYRTKDTKGKKILSFWFDLHTKKTEKQRLLDYANAQTQIARIIAITKEFIKRDEKYIERLKTALIVEPDKAHEVLKKLDRIVAEYPKNDIPKLIRYSLKMDYEIK